MLHSDRPSSVSVQSILRSKSHQLLHRRSTVKTRRQYIDIFLTPEYGFSSGSYKMWGMLRSSLKPSRGNASVYETSTWQQIFTPALLSTTLSTPTAIFSTFTHHLQLGVNLLILRNIPSRPRPRTSRQPRLVSPHVLNHHRLTTLTLRLPVRLRDAPAPSKQLHDKLRALLGTRAHLPLVELLDLGLGEGADVLCVLVGCETSQLTSTSKRNPCVTKGERRFNLLDPKL